MMSEAVICRPAQMQMSLFIHNHERGIFMILERFHNLPMSRSQTKPDSRLLCQIQLISLATYALFVGIFFVPRYTEDYLADG